MSEICISLSKFLSRFANLKGRNLTKMTHDEVAELLPDLKRLPFEMVENDPSLLYMGKAILVDDGKRTIPYEIPKLTLEDIKQFEVYRVQEKPNVTTHVTDYTVLSDYELRMLLRKKFNTQNVIDRAKKEMKKRKKILKKENKNEKY